MTVPMIPAAEFLMPESPSPFLPGTLIQFAWDSTSARSAKACLRRYWYEIVCGWVTRRRQIELDFGIAGHEVLETYHRARALNGKGEAARQAAVRATVAFTMAKFREWTCEEDPLRSRSALLRLAVQFSDDFAEDPLETMSGPNGQPAVEEHFLMELPLQADAGRPYLWGGHRDRRCTDGHAVYVEDFKTTVQTLSPGYFRRFSPDLQMTGYHAAAQRMIPGFAQVVVTGIQVAQSFLRFERGELYRTPEHVEEWWQGIADLLRKVREVAEACMDLAQRGAPMWALASAWPLNEESCFRCPFRGICSETPSLREGLLEVNFTKRAWNPLVARTERRLDKPWMGDREGEVLRG